VSDFSVLLNAEHSHSKLTELARCIEVSGYRGLWYADERFYRETYIGLAVAALATSRIQLGPAVTDPYTRHPALTAAAIASLDELSGGRAVLGYGAGLSGFHNLGIRLDRPATALRDAMKIVRGLLAGKRLTYDGAMISIADAQMQFACRGDVPIYVAADGPMMLRVAGELADGVILAHCASPRILQPKLRLVEAGAQKRTRRPKVVARLDVSVSDERPAAMRAAKIRLGRLLWAQYPEIPYLEAHGLKLPVALDTALRHAGPFRRTHDLSVFRPFADVIPDEFVWPIALAGTPDDVRAQAQAVLAAGADEIMAYVLVADDDTLVAAIRRLARAVGPRRSQSAGGD
jgi:5,10-methylenetetrahydromethanopterin reductase